MRTDTTRPASGPIARRVLPAAAAAMTLLVGVSSALGQDLKPPQPREEPTAPLIMTLLTLVVLALATLFAAAFPSKRGHQD